MRDVAAEQGQVFEPERPDNVHRLNMGVFPGVHRSSATRTTRFRASRSLDVHFVPGFPVMAWPMIEQVLDQRYAHLHGRHRQVERSVIVFGAMEATLTPLMEQVERDHPGVRVFSLPSVDHPQYGRHIELGVKGAAEAAAAAYLALRDGLRAVQAETGPELVR